MDCTTVRLVDGGYIMVKITPEIPVQGILINVLKKVSPETIQNDQLSIYALFLNGDNKRTYLCVHRLWSEVVTTLNLDGSFEFYLELQIIVFPILYFPFISENLTSFQYLLKQVKKKYFDNLLSFNDDKNRDAAFLLGCLEMRQYFEDKDLQSKGSLESIEKLGFVKFFPPNVIAQYKPRQLRKLIHEQLRKWGTTASEETDYKFIDVFKKMNDFESTDIPCTLGAGFALVDAQLVISPKNAIALQIGKYDQLKRVGDFSDLIEVRVDAANQAVKMLLKGKEEEPVVLIFASVDEADFVAHLVDAYRLNGATANDDNTILYHGCTYNEGQENDSVYGEEDYAAFEYGTFGGGGSDSSTPYRELLRHQITLERMLGEGQFGDVYQGIMREGSEDTDVAVKTLKEKQDDAATERFLDEAKTMSQFDHPHIIRLVGVIKEKPVWIVMELAALGELRPYLLENSDSLTSATLMMFCYQISSALCYLESQNIVHRDIAARNILVSSTECVKLTDFGMTRWLQENQPYTATPGKVPLKWMAPESIHYRRFSSASDVWMFGVCMWEILQCGLKPFQGVKNNDAVTMIENGRRLSKPIRCPDTAYRLLMKCWEYEASKRPTFSSLKPQLFEIMNEERKNKIPSRLTRAPSVPARCGALPPPPKPSNPMNVSVEDIINKSMPSLHTIGSSLPSLTIPAASKQPALPTVPGSPRPEDSKSESPPVLRRKSEERVRSAEKRNANLATMPECRKSHSTESVPKDMSLNSADPAGYTNLSSENISVQTPTHVTNPSYVEGAELNLENVYTCVINIVKAVHTLNTRVSLVAASECAELIADIGLKLKLLGSTLDTLIENGFFSQSRLVNLKLARSVVTSDFADVCNAFKLAHGASHIPKLYRDYCVDVLQKAHALAIDSRHVYEAASGPEISGPRVSTQIDS